MKACNLRFVSFINNRVYHYGIEKNPYEGMPGCPEKITSSIIPKNILLSINYEVDLEKLDDIWQTVVITGSQTNFNQDGIA